MMMDHQIPIQTLHLFPVLDQMLSDLLKSLTPKEWELPTIARLWTVKDIAAHLLDGNLRGLSIARDGFTGVTPGKIENYQDLVAFLNELNADWVKASRRLSPQVLISMLETSGREYIDHLHTLDPFANAVFSVAWAGQEVSPNWFHVAREYTEKYLHQQQIREALGRPGLITKELFHPFIDTFMVALPHTFRHVQAATGTVVAVTITTEAGGEWRIVKSENGWKPDNGTKAATAAAVEIDPGIAWKLFSKSWSPDQVMGKVKLSGDQQLARQTLELVAVMA